MKCWLSEACTSAPLHPWNMLELMPSSRGTAALSLSTGSVTRRDLACWAVISFRCIFDAVPARNARTIGATAALWGWCMHAKHAPHAFMPVQP